MHDFFALYIRHLRQVPRDLTCLKGCFKLFPIAPELEEIKKKCSAVGFDRLVPTHTKAGQDYMKSNYADASVIWDESENGYSSDDSIFNYASTSWNPNIDCLVWQWKSLRQKENELDDIEFTALEALMDFASSNAIETQRNGPPKNSKPKEGKGRKGVRKGKRKYDNRAAKNKNDTRQNTFLDEAGVWSWAGANQFFSNVAVEHTRNCTICEKDPHKRNLFLATNPVAKALEICVLAKAIQVHNAWVESRCPSQVFLMSPTDQPDSSSCKEHK